jgi:alkanesulfonate monooxygenase SsuD/methylene tetrahydromethanopterin reductase-like flavin-dependent oxidoreductase (luciferase family)
MAPSAIELTTPSRDRGELAGDVVEMRGNLGCRQSDRERIWHMHIDLLFDPFGATWPDVREGAIAAEGEGFDGVWLYDHLAGSVHGQDRVLECWTTLAAIAAVVPAIAVGPMVLNVANRDPGTLAVMAATLQEVSEGRLLLGLGAGGGIETPYEAEQRALGRPVPGDRARRAALAAAIATLRSVWSGSVGGVGGFLRPDPPPPIIVGGFGPKMAELAGRIGDGVNLPDGPRLGRLLETARAAGAAAGRDLSTFVVTVSAGLHAASLKRLEELEVDRVVVYVDGLFAEQVRLLAASQR